MFSVYHEPKVIKNFLTDEECDFLINWNGAFKKTHFVENDALTGVDSLTKVIPLKMDKLNIIKKVSNKFNIPISMFGDLVVIKYIKNGFIGPHIDSIPSVQRPHTIIFYLNDEYNGGETHFPNLNKSFKLNKGDILFFHNKNSNGEDSILSTHEGKTVTSGEKWVCNLWTYDD